MLFWSPILALPQVCSGSKPDDLLARPHGRKLGVLYIGKLYKSQPRF